MVVPSARKKLVEFGVSDNRRDVIGDRRHFE
jgi:hypothetical protein